MSRLTTIQIDGIIRRHLPRGWKLRISQQMKTQFGYTHPAKKEIVMYHHVRHWTRWSLMIFLHEVGHVRIKHDVDAPAHVEEYEAELYAMYALRHEGIPVPCDGLDNAKRNVRVRIHEDEAKGIPILPHIERWANRSKW